MERVLHAPESARFYDRRTLGVVLEVPKKDGKGMTKPTIRHARAHGFLPSVSEIIKGKAAPELEYWKMERLLSIAWEHRGDTAEQAEWITSVHREFEDGVSFLADRGTELHAMILGYFETGEKPEDKAALRAIDAIRNHFGDGFRVEQGVSVPGMYAGRTDMVDEHFVADLKTTDLSKFRKPYYKWGLQLAAYADAAALDYEAAMMQVVTDRETGETRFIAWGQDKLMCRKDLSAAFRHLFAEWCIANQYDPRDWKP